MQLSGASAVESAVTEFFLTNQSLNGLVALTIGNQPTPV